MTTCQNKKKDRAQHKHKDIFNVHWPNSAGLIEGFCTVCEQPWVDLNPPPFALKATTLTTAPWRLEKERTE